MKPKIKEIRMQIHTNEGTTCVSWEPGKRAAKKFGFSEDPVKWFKHCVAQAKEHYPEGMGG